MKLTDLGSGRHGIILLHLLAIALLSLLAYSNTFGVPFHFDGIEAIAKNPLIKDMRYFKEPSKLDEAFEELFKEDKKHKKLNYSSRIVGYFTFALNYRLHGLDVTGYHITNLVVHILSALLVYFLVLLTFRTPFLECSSLKDSSGLIALFAGLLFASHPIQTQAVTYIYQRLSSLAAFFYLASLVCYVQSRLSQRRDSNVLFYALSVASAILAMKTKEIAITLPVSVLLYEVFFLQGTRRKRALLLAPLFLASLMIPLTLLDIDRPLGEVLSDAGDMARQTTDITRWDYLFTQFRVITTYIRLLFLPVNQNLDYDYPVFNSFFNAEVLSSFVLLSSIVALGVFLFYRSRRADPGVRLISFGIFWFFITLSVESSFIPIADVIFEHRVYLPSAGAFTALVAGVFVSFRRARGKKADALVVAVFTAITVVLSSAAYARNSVWKSEISLWEDVIRKSSGKGSVSGKYLKGNIRGYSILSKAYMDEGQFDKAIELCLSALSIDPFHIDTLVILGNAYMSKGQLEKAIEQYRFVLKVSSYYPDVETTTLGEVNYNLALASDLSGMRNEALKYYQEAIAVDPHNADAYNNIGALYFRKGFIDNAIEYYNKALITDPEYEPAHFNLGEAFLAKGLAVKAKEYLQTYLQFRPDDEEANRMLGIANEKLGVTRKAYEQRKEVQGRKNPDSE